MSEVLTLGKKLRALRKHRNKDVKYMMSALDISKPSYDVKEKSDNDNLTAETIFKLSKALEVGADYFFLNLTPEEYDEYHKNKGELYMFANLDEDRRKFVREMMIGLEYGQKSTVKDEYVPEWVKKLSRPLLAS